MIHTLHIHNFQSHKNTTLEFTKGVNVIVGPSDSGKTSLIRALRWVVWNRPLGDAMRSRWGGSTQVTLQLDTQTITRIKNKQDEYKLDEHTFKAFGTDVPDEIANALNISDLNLQSQLEQPFLITDSPGAVALHFNNIARLNQIDTGLKNIQRYIREIEQNTKSEQSRLGDLEEELKTFTHLDKLEVSVELVERMESDLIACSNSRHTLKRLVSNVRDIELELSELEPSLKLGEHIDVVLGLIHQRKTLLQTEEVLVELVTDLQETNEELQRNEQFLKVESKVNALSKLQDTLSKTIIDKEKLTSLIEDVRQYNTTLEQMTISLKRDKESFHQLMPETCPLCGQKITNHE